VIPIILSSTNRLYLTQFEADGLADHLRQTLICRTAGQANDPVIIADTPIPVAEAWELFDRLNLSRDEIVDWLKDGF
jgi:hypothetical protein